MKIYIASKTKHADKWKQLRAAGWDIISSWIDEAGAGESESLSDLWLRCVAESKGCDILLAYREEGDELKGTFIEIGSALAFDRPVILAGVWPSNWSFINHPLVVHRIRLADALMLIEQRSRYAKS